MKFANTPKFGKLIILYFLISFSITFLLIRNSPAIGYEISIYESTPLIWIILIINAFVGITVISIRTFHDNINMRMLWIVIFMTVNNFIIISIYALRQYYQYSLGDSLSHTDIIENIVTIGHTDYQNNFYPVLHILYAISSIITNIEPISTSKNLTAYMSILSMMIFIVMLAKFIDKKTYLIVFATSLILPFNYFHVQTYPHAFSIFLFPIIFYLYFKYIEKRSLSFTILIFLFLILMPFSHPSGIVTFIIIITLTELVRFIKTHNISIEIILIPTIIFFVWISTFWVFNFKVRNTFSSIFDPYEYQNPHLDVFLNISSRLNLLESIEIFLKMYGKTLIYTIISIYGGLKIIQKKENLKLLLLFIIFLSGIFVQFILFVLVGSQSFGRFMSLANYMTVAPILVGYTLYDHFKNRKYAGVLFAVVILFIFVISIFSLYHSPWIFSPSIHITKMDKNGAMWFYNHQNTTLKFDAFGFNDFGAFINSSNIGSNTEFLKLPEHFNYTRYSTIGKSILENGYLITNVHSRQANSDPMLLKARFNMQEGWNFSDNDFKKFNMDINVARIYSNNELEIYMVYKNNLSNK